MGGLKIITVVFLFLVLGVAEESYADCSGPVAVAGEMRWNSGASEIQACNGTSWLSMSNTPTANTCTTAGEIKYITSDVRFCNGTVWVSMNTATLAGTCTAAEAGTMTYSTSDSNMRWCNGTNWQVMGASSGSGLAVNYLASAQNLVDTTDYTFTNVSLGTPASNRYILIGFGCRGGSTPSTVTVTVGGVSTTIVHKYGTGGSIAGFAIAQVPTGVSGDIVVKFNVTMVRAAIHVWSLTGLQSTTSSSNLSFNGTTASGNLTIPAGGTGFAVNYTQGTTNVTWTGLSSVGNEILTEAASNGAVGAATKSSAAGEVVTVSTPIRGYDAGAVIALK